MSTDAAAGLALPVLDEALAGRLKERLAVVEEMLEAHTHARSDYVSDVAAHLMSAGGKRFRPLLVLLAAEAGPTPDADEVMHAACVVELTHVASLYHDDVMDEAPLRRGAPTANDKWDNNTAILVGDFLFGRSSEVTAELGPVAVRIQARTFMELVEGQILEGIAPAAGVDPLEHYLQVVDGKTASLISTSARYGAMFGGASVGVIEALAAYGTIVGSAFQLSDDILDIASDSEDSGKTPGTDLREGVPTLPTLMAQASTDPADDRLKQLLAGPITDDVEVAEALALLRVHPAMEQARDYVQTQVVQAKAKLEVLPEGGVRQALEAFADVVADRSV